MPKRAVIFDQDRESALAFGAALKGPDLSIQLIDDEEDFYAELDAEHTDLVVLRAEMDKASGYSVCNRLRASDKRKGLKIAIVTLLRQDPRLGTHKLSASPADVYIAPPLGLKDLRLQAYAQLDLDGGTVGDDDIQAIEEDPFAKLDEVLSEGGLAKVKDGGDAQPSTERRKLRADFSDDELDGAFGNIDPESAKKNTTEVGDESIEEEQPEELAEDDILEVAEAQKVASPLQSLSAEEMSFVANTFGSVSREPKAPPLPPGMKKKNLQGPEGKIEMLRDKLREREEEIIKLQDIWKQHETQFKESAQRVLDMQVEVKAAQLEAKEAKDKLKQKEADAAQRVRESSASIDRLVEEKVLLEKDLIEVVAAKEKTVAEQRRMMAAREREIETLNATLEVERRNFAEFKAQSEQAYAALEQKGVTELAEAQENGRNDLARARTEAKQAADQAQKNFDAAIAAEQQTHEKERGLLEARFAQERGDLDARIADVVGALSKMTEERDRLQNDLRLAESKMAEQREDLATREAREVENAKELGQTRERLVQVETQLAEKTQTLSSDLEQAKSDREGLQQRLTERLNEKEEQLKQKDQTVAELSKEVTALRAERDALTERLSMRLKERETEIATLKEQLQQSSEKSATQQGELDALRRGTSAQATPVAAATPALAMPTSVAIPASPPPPAESRSLLDEEGAMALTDDAVADAGGK